MLLLHYLSSVRKAGGDYHACVDQAVLNSPGRKPSGKRADGTAVLTFKNLASYI